MKKLLVIALAIFISACSSSDDYGCNDKSGLVGTWELTKQEGYEINGEYKEEWNTKSDDFDATYVFNCDRTGKYTFYEHFDGNESSSTASIKWEYTTTGKTLAVDYVDAGDMKIYAVENISSSALVLVTHNEDNGYEYYNKETYTRK